MRGFVGEERDLREENPQGCGDQQLEPAVAQKDESRHASGERDEERRAHGQIEPGSAAEKPALADDL